MAYDCQPETVHLLEDFDVEQQNEVNMNAHPKGRVENVPPTKYLTLPPGKSFHMFISHSGDDSEEVWELIKKLETRFKIRCLYADRDFQPGKDITDNIKESIEISMKILLILSPSYLDSGYCWFEPEGGLSEIYHTAPELSHSADSEAFWGETAFSIE